MVLISKSQPFCSATASMDVDNMNKMENAASNQDKLSKKTCWDNWGNQNF